MSDWIKTSDQLPGTEFVLAFGGDSGSWTTQPNIGIAYNAPDWNDNGAEQMYDSPTHWMELPDPPTADNLNGWIPITERLPDVDKLVLQFGPECGGVVDGVTMEVEPMWKEYEWKPEESWSPTHWRELPELPKEDQ